MPTTWGVGIVPGAEGHRSLGEDCGGSGGVVACCSWQGVVACDVLRGEQDERGEKSDTTEREGTIGSVKDEMRSGANLSINM